MNSEPNRAEALFAKALKLNPGERTAFLTRECAEDAALRKRVEALLAAHEEATGFLPDDSPDAFSATRIVEIPFSPPDQNKLTEQPGAVIDRYKLLEKLGEGGFGAVWAAEQKEPVRRRVALKIIKLGMDTQQVVARFEAERQALALMDHPNIAKVLDAGSTEGGRPYFVMELVRGIAITKYCDQEKLDVEARLDLFIKVCQAIQHAHQKGIIHRDIKPSNVMVTLHDGVPVPKVIDFGIAKATQQELTEKTIYTQYSQFIGTPAYMSPEQAEMSGLDIDTRSDIYSLGVLLYELLTGSTPFDSKELMQSGLDEMRKIIREREPVRPSTKLSQTLSHSPAPASTSTRPSMLASDLDWIVMKCLEKDRTRRYDTATGVAMDLKRHLSNEPILARPPSTAYRFQKAWRRNKLAWSAAGAVAMSLVIGISVSLWQMVLARDAEQNADQARIAEKEQKLAAQAEAERANAAEQSEKQLRVQAEQQELAARQRAYAADMRLCQRALAMNNLREARQLLEKQRPSIGENDLRGWEWRWLWDACRSDSLFDLGGKQSRVLQAIYVDGGRSVLTYEDQGGVHRINLDSRRTETLQEPAPAFTRSLRSNSGLMSASQDRRWVAAVGMEEDGYLVRIWDVSANTPPRKIPVGKALVSSVAISPDGSTLATYTPDHNSAYIWDINHPGSGKPRQIRLDFTRKTLNVYGAVRFSPDGRTLAVGGVGGQVRLVTTQGRIEDWTEKGVFVLPTSERQSVSTLDFSPDGRLLACGCMFIDPRVFVVDVESGNKVQVLSGHRGFIGGLSFSPDGRTLASASADQTVKFWEVGTWKERGTLLGHTDEVWCANFSQDGGQLVSGGKDLRLLVWSPAKLPDHDRDLLDAVPSASTKTLHIAPGGKRSLYVADGVVNLVGRQSHAPAPAVGTNILTAFWISQDQIAAMADDKLEIKLWNLASDSVDVHRIGGAVPSLENIHYLPNARMIILEVPGGNSTDVQIIRWDVASRKTASTCTLPIGAQTAQMRGCFSQDGRSMAVSDWDSVSIYDLANGKLRSTMSVTSKSGIQGMALSPDGKQLALAQRDESAIIIMEVGTSNRVATLLGHNLVINKLEYSPDGTRLLSNTIGSEAVKVWSTSTWMEVARLEPPQGVYYSAPQFTSDSAGIVVSSYRFDSGPEGARLFLAPGWTEIEEARAWTGR